MTRLIILACLALPAAWAGETVPTYQQLAKAPAAYGGTQRFTMRFAGLKPVDRAFAPLHRNASTHLMLVEPTATRSSRWDRPAGASLAGSPAKEPRRLPMFVKLSSSTLVRTLRALPTGVPCRFEGRMMYFKVPVYDASSLQGVRGPSLKIEHQQSLSLSSYLTGTKLSTDGSGRQGPTASGYAVHHVLDIKGVRELKQATPSGSARGAQAKPAPGYQQVSAAQLARLGGGGKSLPIKLRIPYRGRLGPLSRQPGLARLASRFKGPSVSCVKAGDVDLRPPGDLSLLAPPGPLSRVVVIGYGKDWEVARSLASLQEGDLMELTGTLSPAPAGSSSRFVLILEGLEKVGEGARRVRRRGR